MLLLTGSGSLEADGKVTQAREQPGMRANDLDHRETSGSLGTGAPYRAQPALVLGVLVEAELGLW